MRRNGACAGSSAPIFHARSAACGIIHLTFDFTRADQIVQIQGGRLSGIHGSLLRDCCRDPCFCRHGRRCRGREHRTRNDGLQLYGNEGACGQLYHQYGHRHPDREAQPCPCAGNCKSGGRYHVPLAWCRHPEDVKTTRMNARPLRHGHVQFILDPGTVNVDVKVETTKVLKQYKAYLAQFEEMLNDERIA